MKDDTLLTIGIIGIGAYAAYKLMKPVSETVGQVGEGIGTAFQGAGTGTSEIFTGVSSPFQYADALFAQQQAFMEAQNRTQLQREQVLLDLYKYDKDIQGQLKTQTQSKEQTKTYGEQTKEEKAETKYDLQHFNTETTAQSLENNKAETAARKTEYGATTGQYLQKMFMPTKEVAQERRQAVVNTVKKAYTSVVSLFTKKK